MTPERWSEIERICQAALDRRAGERADYLAQACAGDDALRDEVETRLAEESRAAGFMSGPAAAAMNGGGGGRAVIGRRLGAYVIGEWLGAGGMGDYRAHDARLGRDVAIKVLPH